MAESCRSHSTVVIGINKKKIPTKKQRNKHSNEIHTYKHGFV